MMRRVLLIVLAVAVRAPAQEMHTTRAPVVWVFNSDAAVPRYRNAEAAFLDSWTNPVRTINGGEQMPTRAQTERWRRSDRPTHILCIGSKALQAAARLAEGETLVAVAALARGAPLAYKRALIIDARPHPESELALLRTYLPRARVVGVVCGEGAGNGWIAEAKSAADRLNVTLDIRRCAGGRDAVDIVGRAIAGWDALWIVPDPDVLDSHERVNQLFAAAREACRPVLTYTAAFAALDPALIIEADEATAARQAAEWIREGRTVDALEIVPPAGTRVILNLRELIRCGIEWNSDAIDTVNELIR